MPLPRPSPAATITVMEIIPHAMPNMVSIVRRLCAHSVLSVSFSKSWNDNAGRLFLSLLQNYLLLFIQAFKNFRFYTIRNSQFHVNFFLSVCALSVGKLRLRFALFVIDQRCFGNHQDVLL